MGFKVKPVPLREQGSGCGFGNLGLMNDCTSDERYVGNGVLGFGFSLICSSASPTQMQIPIRQLSVIPID